MWGGGGLSGGRVWDMRGKGEVKEWQVCKRWWSVGYLVVECGVCGGRVWRKW